MTLTLPSRRTFLSAAAGAAVAAPALIPARAKADGPFSDGFPYELTRSEDEWRAILTDEEYRILREGWTERRFTSELTEEQRPGTYFCRGSDLAIYTHEHKVILSIGWVFFRHAIPDTVMLGIDVLPAEYDEAGMTEDEPETMMEVHCRRSGNHLGHIVSIDGVVLHCINGTALEFVPDAA